MLEQPDSRWLSTDPEAGDPYADVRAYWPNVDEVPPDALEVVLLAAAAQCEQYAPPLPEQGEPLPTAWLMAQAMQARALWRSGTVGGGDQYGTGEYTVTVFPMDWTVKALLRPRRGRPVIA